MWSKLEQEKEFLAALDRARWEAYPLVLSDLGIIVEGVIRTKAPRLPALTLADWLVVAYGRSLRRYGEPQHRDAGASWEPDIESFRIRIGRAQMAPPRRVHEIGSESGYRLHQLMPIHKAHTKLDADMIANSVKMRLCRVHEDLLKRLNISAIAMELSPHRP